ncbi:hypothetical protein ID866_807 [Astraeus odoratus]|nr:hypothetical protein ID866_807 [Astraeus odoratus]
MTTTTMHFGPEWMRAKPQTPARQQPPPSPPPLHTTPTAQQSTTSTYSSLVTQAAQEQERHDESRPFRYTKEEMLRIYKEGGGKGGLGLEVERWEGIVREMGSEPASLREMDEAEKKSDVPVFIKDQPPLIPRKLSLSTMQSGPSGPTREALPSPRNRMGAFGSGFDGVLNNGDSWSRRRPSAHFSGVNGGPSSSQEIKDDGPRQSDIKEEAVEEGIRRTSDVHEVDSPGTAQHPSSADLDAPPPDSAVNDQPSAATSDLVVQGIADMTLLEPNNPDLDQQVSNADAPVTSALPGLPDPANVEWSYLDPQGQVQGPFRADVMQKWFNEGYFASDLLMRRTHLDSEWIPVGVLERRANGGKIFLSQLPASCGPPGLTLRTESPQSYSSAADHSTFNGYQPVPQRPIRSATLDSSYINNASPSDSPSSSLGAGTFGNGSPDPTAFSGRATSSVYSADPNFAGLGLSTRAPFQDPVIDPRIPFNSNTLNRAPSLDTYGNYNGGSPWPSTIGSVNQGFSGPERRSFSNGYSSLSSNVMGPGVPVNQIHGFNQESFNNAPYNNMGSLTSHHDSPLTRQTMETNGVSFNDSMIMNSLNGSQYGSSVQYSQTPSAVFPPTQQHQTVTPFGEVLTQTSESPHMPHTPASAVQPTNATSPWPDPSPIRRTRTFDAAAGSPVPLAQTHQGSNWGRSAQPTHAMTAKANDPSPWLTASLGGINEAWKEIPGPNSLTFSNVGQHNKHHEQEEEVGMTTSPVEEEAPVFLASPQVPATEPVSPPTASVMAQTTIPTTTNAEPQVPPKSRRKSTVREVQTSQKAPPPPTLTIAKGSSPTPVSPTPAPKSAWSTEDESKKVKPAVTMSLREIQEAEAKKMEARKAEKEKERLARASSAAAASAAEDSQPFVTSWGLPTSQAGARNVVVTKESSVSTPASATPSTPVWTNTAPTAVTKKSMKEIQEEEERRKKTAVKESVASAATRRAYAETTFKVIPSAQNTTGGAWTTVGANGKATTPVTAPPRPAMPASTTNVAASQVATHRQNGVPARPATAAVVAAAAAPKPVTTPRAEDSPSTPSHDFLKWLSDSLKGLNSSVNMEEITSMLLSFPLDPDPSTIEIISDLIYANSTTLDGRRFASEYVSRRKADATARRGATATTGNGGKPVSIADVVKTQPKPVQQEWSFKVVNKKKKGGKP